MVRPQLDYALDVWDLYHVVKLEKVQRRAAHWVMNNHGRYLLLCFPSITYMTTMYNNTGTLNPCSNQERWIQK